MSFDSLGLCDELLKTVEEQGYTTPSPIQIKAIPAVLSQRDVMAVAHTGTGKTAGFTLPVLQLLSSVSSSRSIRSSAIQSGLVQNAPIHSAPIHSAPIHDTPIHSTQRARAKFVRALIITPTRELAAQVALSIKNYSRHMNISSTVVFGGVRIEPQISELQSGLDVLVATPGRLLDLYNRQAVNFEQLEILVLDEADRMLELGFIDDIRRIQMLLPTKRQSLMFSATFSKDIKSFAKGMLNNPLLIEVVTAKTTINSIKQKLHPVDKERKSEALVHLIKSNSWHQVLVFIRTKHGADSLVLKLKKVGISAAAIHADRTQHARTHVLEEFKNRNITVLVATDIASRGIDVNQLPCVVNFDLPYVPEDYVHRIGRTGRAGNCGLAVSLFSEDESKQLQSIERVIGHKFELETLLGFTPSKKASADLLSDNDNNDNNDNNEDEYGNFEADPKPRVRGQSQGRRNRK
jgi:ATP-dependent RNA helicase RhlE